jgi:type II secretory pathway pseudopilin PulG
MHLTAGSSARSRENAFSLVEILLTTALLLLLMTAVIVSFSKMRQGSELTEGATQFETMLRLARAQAAETGRNVRILFEADEADPWGVPLYHPRLAWEPDPLGRPGVFEDLIRESWPLKTINELVAVANVQIEPLALPEPAADSEPTNAAGPVPASSDDPAGPEPLPAITFQPDGSSISARVTLVSRADDDPRRVIITLGGLTGSLTRTLSEPVPENNAEAPRPAAPGASL